MTHDEIQKMVGHKLDATIQRGFMDPIPHGMVPATIAPSYHDDLNACHAAEERLKEMGLTEQFKAALEDTIHHDGSYDESYDMDWCKIHAPADQRARAILLAKERGETT